MQITQHFSYEEFKCHDGTAYPSGWVSSRLKPLCMALEMIREAVGVPLTITSGYRTVAHNRKVGGSPKSQHVEGRAVDIQAQGVSAEKLHNIILDLIKQGKISEGGVGAYNSWVHYDQRGFKARWRG